MSTVVSKVSAKTARIIKAHSYSNSNLTSPTLIGLISTNTSNFNARELNSMELVGPTPMDKSPLSLVISPIWKG